MNVSREGFFALPVAYRGVLVSLKPRNTPCIARESATAGEPSALKVRYFLAGTSIGDPYLIQEENFLF